MTGMMPRAHFSSLHDRIQSQYVMYSVALLLLWSASAESAFVQSRESSASPVPSLSSPVTIDISSQLNPNSSDIDPADRGLALESAGSLSSQSRHLKAAAASKTSSISLSISLSPSSSPSLSSTQSATPCTCTCEALHCCAAGISCPSKLDSNQILSITLPVTFGAVAVTAVCVWLYVWRRKQRLTEEAAKESKWMAHSPVMPSGSPTMTAYPNGQSMAYGGSQGYAPTRYSPTQYGDENPSLVMHSQGNILPGYTSPSNSMAPVAFNSPSNMRSYVGRPDSAFMVLDGGSVMKQRQLSRPYHTEGQHVRTVFVDPDGEETGDGSVAVDEDGVVVEEVIVRQRPRRRMRRAQSQSRHRHRPRVRLHRNMRPREANPIISELGVTKSELISEVADQIETDWQAAKLSLRNLKKQLHQARQVSNSSPQRQFTRTRKRLMSPRLASSTQSLDGCILDDDDEEDTLDDDT